MSELRIHERVVGHVVVLELTGKLHLGAGSTELRNAINGLLEGGAKEILLNLEHVSHMDSSGVGELVGAYAKAKRHGAQLRLENLVGRVHGLLEITKLVTVFETFADEGEAIASFHRVQAA